MDVIRSIDGLQQLLPHRPSAPRLHELVGPSCAGEELRMLALRRAVCDARSGARLILARDFKAAPWEALVHWTGDGRATSEALVAVVEHLGNGGAIPRLRRPGAPNQLDQQALHS